MIVGVVRENFPGEKRVALVPASIPNLAKVGATVLIEKGAGTAAGFPDQFYLEKGAQLVESRQEAFERSDILFQVRGYGTNPEAGKQDLQWMKPDQIVVGMWDPLGNLAALQEVADRKVNLFALEMIPRITLTDEWFQFSAEMNSPARFPQNRNLVQLCSVASIR